MYPNTRRSRPRSAPPVLITSAGWSRRDEIRHREHRYLLAMLVRLVVFIVAAVALPTWTRLLGMVAAIFIPWLAVLYANTGPLRGRKGRPSLYAPDPGALPDDPYPLTDGGQTIVPGEWTDPGRDRDQSSGASVLPALRTGYAEGRSAAVLDHQESAMADPGARRPHGTASRR